MPNQTSTGRDIKLGEHSDSLHLYDFSLSECLKQLLSKANKQVPQKCDRLISPITKARSHFGNFMAKLTY